MRISSMSYLTRQNNRNLSRSFQKLSTGKRINSAADDAAGLAIAQKLLKQANGLDAGVYNARTSQNLLNVAEGAMGSVTDSLQRINELSIQAANGTYSSSDRSAIQAEIDQLTSEINRVSETTKFNETYLLKGDSTKAATRAYTANYAVAYTLNQGNTDKVKHKVNYTGDSNLYLVNTAAVKSGTARTPVTADVITKGDDVTKYLSETVEGQNGKLSDASFNAEYTAFKSVDMSGVKVTTTGTAAGDTLLYENGSLTAQKDAYILDTDTNSVIQIKGGEDLSNYINVNDDKTAVSMKDRYRMLDEVVPENTATTNGTGNATLGTNTLGHDINKTLNISIGDDFRLDESTSKLYDINGREVSGTALNQYFDRNGQYTGGLYADAQATKAVVNDNTAGATDETKIGSYVTKNYTDVAADLGFSFHVGADSAGANKVTGSIQSMSSASLGIDRLGSTSVGLVDTSGNKATNAIDVIADALQQVSTQRSALGATSNRLDHSIAYGTNALYNMTASHSRIMDQDYAKGVTELKKNQLLQTYSIMMQRKYMNNESGRVKQFFNM